MISGQWFCRRFLKIGQKLRKTTRNSMKNKGSTPNFTNLVGGLPEEQTPTI